MQRPWVTSRGCRRTFGTPGSLAPAKGHTWTPRINSCPVQFRFLLIYIFSYLIWYSPPRAEQCIISVVLCSCCCCLGWAGVTRALCPFSQGPLAFASRGWGDGLGFHGENGPIGESVPGFSPNSAVAYLRCFVLI